MWMLIGKEVNMYPFYNAPTFPFGSPFIPFQARKRVPTIDRYIPELCTTGIVENTEGIASVDYGVNPWIWKRLPNQTLALWKVRHPVSQSGASLPVNVVIPTGNSSTTVASGGATTGTSKVSVVDNKGTKTQGSDVTVPTGSGGEGQESYTTEHIVYIDKCSGIFRLLGVTAQGSQANASSEDSTPVENSVKSK